jgi:uncharacterized membrane protein YccF (DUF307 family)
VNKTVVVTKQNPGCLVQILWFALVGWWAGELWIAAAWFLMLTVVGAPLAVAMLNRLPQVIALRGHTTSVKVTRVDDLEFRVSNVRVPQRPFLLRLVYFILVGWWLTALWMQVAYALCLSIIGLPVGFWMFDQVPVLLTLRR